MRANYIEKLNYIIHKVIECVIICFTAGMVIVVSCNVFARYCLKSSLVWAEELSMVFFVWVVFLGAYYALTTKSHLALSFLVKRVPKKIRIIDKYIVLMLVMFFLVVLCVGGIQFVKNVIVLGQRTPLLKISAAWSYACVPVSALLMLFEIIVILFKKEAIVDLKEIGLDS